MSKAQLALAAACCCLAASVSAENSNTESKFKVVGKQSDARNVCTAVLQDDPVRLKMLLMHERNSLLYGYRYELTDEYVAGAYRCNDQSLDDFAMQMGAQNINRFLRGGIVTIEEMVTSID